MKWSKEDAQRFKDRDILKAGSVPGKRPPGPQVTDWEEPVVLERTAWAQQDFRGKTNGY